MRRLAAALIALSVAGCGAPPAASPSASTQVIARVGTTSITLGQFQLRLTSALAQARSAGAPTNVAAMTSQFRASVLRSLLIDTVIAQEARAAGVAATDQEVQQQYLQDATAAGGASPLASQLASLGGSPAQLQDEIRSSINESQLENLFAQQRAAEVERRIAAGASIASLAPQYSDDTASASSGGELGAVTRAAISSGDAAFSTAVLALRVGQYTTTPIRDSQGYDIVEVEAENATSLTLRHIVIAAPQPYTVKDRPIWFSEAIFETLATDCARNQIAIYISDVGDNPCAAVSASGSASPGATPAPGPTASP
ncbi:MAG: peptidylprolyl isomerase [Candidatus Dormibacteria bacterium]